MCGIFLASLGWSQSLGKDTGLGSTSEQNGTPMSGLDLMSTPAVQQRYGNFNNRDIHRKSFKLTMFLTEKALFIV